MGSFVTIIIQHQIKEIHLMLKYFKFNELLAKLNFRCFQAGKNSITAPHNIVLLLKATYFL